MIALIQITPWHWAGFILLILALLALDLGWLNRQSGEVTFRQALRWSLIWCTLAMLFAMSLVMWRGREESVEFITGYIIELSLSMDNLFLIALIFTYFQVPPQHQRRVLYLGIIGALVMRGVMIIAGAAVIKRYEWTLYLLGAFLIYAGLRMMTSGDLEVVPEKNIFIRLARRIFPVTNEPHGEKLVVKINGRRMITTLMLVLIMVETTDLLFAVDSVPAVFAVTTKPFIVFTSNVFAILGLRSLYFVLVGAIGYFRYLKVGLSAVLVFVGAKMVLAPHGDSHQWYQVKVDTLVSLLVIAFILGICILLSIRASAMEQEADQEQDS